MNESLRNVLREHLLTEEGKKLPGAAYDLLRDASMSTPPQTKYMKPARKKYVPDMIKRGWLEYVNKGHPFDEGVKITDAGREALKAKKPW
jgi:hypothetical protein